MGTNLKVENKREAYAKQEYGHELNDEHGNQYQEKSKEVTTTTTKWVRDKETIAGTNVEMEADMFE